MDFKTVPDSKIWARPDGETEEKQKGPSFYGHSVYDKVRSKINSDKRRWSPSALGRIICSVIRVNFGPHFTAIFGKRQ